MGRHAKAAVTALGALLLVLIGGCGSMGGIHQADAFGRSKTYAVVSVVASEKVGCSDIGGNPCNGGVLGLVNTVANSNAYSENAQEVLESTYPAVLQALRSSPNLRIVPDVKAQRVYRDTPADEQPSGMMSARYAVAKGYKYFSDEKLARLARDLKVDGVITVWLSYTAARSGVQVVGLGGGHQAVTNVMVTAVDKNGKKVWFDHAIGHSDDSAGTLAGTVNFPKLRPMFGDATAKAARQIMASFDQKMRKM